MFAVMIKTDKGSHMVSGFFNTLEEADIERIYLQPDYDELLIVKNLKD